VQVSSTRSCLSSPHVSSTSIQCFPYARSKLYCTVYTHLLRHISHTQRSTYTIYISMVRMTSVVEVCEVIEFGLCGCVSFFLHLRDDNAFEVRHSLLMMAVLCCHLHQFSNSCRFVLLGLGLGLESGLGSVLVYSISIRFGVTVSC